MAALTSIPTIRPRSSSTTRSITSSPDRPLTKPWGRPPRWYARPGRRMSQMADMPSLVWQACQPILGRYAIILLVDLPSTSPVSAVSSRSASRSVSLRPCLPVSSDSTCSAWLRTRRGACCLAGHAPPGAARSSRTKSRHSRFQIEPTSRRRPRRRRSPVGRRPERYSTGSRGRAGTGTRAWLSDRCRTPRQCPIWCWTGSGKESVSAGRSAWSPAAWTIQRWRRSIPASTCPTSLPATRLSPSWSTRACWSSRAWCGGPGGWASKSAACLSSRAAGTRAATWPANPRGWPTTRSTHRNCTCRNGSSCSTSRRMLRFETTCTAR